MLFLFRSWNNLEHYRYSQWVMANNKAEVRVYLSTAKFFLDPKSTTPRHDLTSYTLHFQKVHEIFCSVNVQRQRKYCALQLIVDRPLDMWWITALHLAFQQYFYPKLFQ